MKGFRACRFLFLIYCSTNRVAAKSFIQLHNEKYKAIRSRIYVGVNLLINMLLKLMMSHLFVFVRPTSNEVFLLFVFLGWKNAIEEYYKRVGRNQHQLVCQFSWYLLSIFGNVAQVKEQSLLIFMSWIADFFFGFPLDVLKTKWSASSQSTGKHRSRHERMKFSWDSSYRLQNSHVSNQHSKFAISLTWPHIWKRPRRSQRPSNPL
jgi:hypothetical protein